MKLSKLIFLFVFTLLFFNSCEKNGDLESSLLEDSIQFEMQENYANIENVKLFFRSAEFKEYEQFLKSIDTVNKENENELKAKYLLHEAALEEKLKELDLTNQDILLNSQYYLSEFGGPIDVRGGAPPCCENALNLYNTCVDNAEWAFGLVLMTASTAVIGAAIIAGFSGIGLGAVPAVTKWAGGASAVALINLSSSLSACLATFRERQNACGGCP